MSTETEWTVGRVIPKWPAEPPIGSILLDAEGCYWTRCLDGYWGATDSDEGLTEAVAVRDLPAGFADWPEVLAGRPLTIVELPSAVQ